MESIVGRYEFYPYRKNLIDEEGLRLRGIVKKSGKLPLLSYITVVKNSEKTIERCIRSVLTQNYKNVEYIIIDGGSSDGTVDLIKKYSSDIDYFISISDKGPFNAMNIGLSLVKGDIINFINADDWLHPGVASKVASCFIREKTDMIVGSALVYDNSDFKYIWLPRPVVFGTIFFGSPVCHQATYSTKNLFEKIGGFDEKYKIIADLKWMVCAGENNAKVFYTDEVFANYSLGGISCDKERDRKERFLLIKEIFPDINNVDAEILLRELDVSFMYERNSFTINSIVLEIANKYCSSRLYRGISEALFLVNYELKRMKRVANITANLKKYKGRWYEKIIQKVYKKS